MYTMLPWFTALIDVVDMAISKCEPTIAANYDAQLVKNLDHPDVHKLVALGDRLRKEFALTKKHLLELRGYNVPQEENDILLRGLRVRNPMSTLSTSSKLRCSGGFGLENTSQVTSALSSKMRSL